MDCYEIYFVYCTCRYISVFSGLECTLRVRKMAIKMLVIVLFFSTCAAFTRSFIDYDTIVGNCTRECPVFAKPVDGNHISCYEKMALVERIRPWQTVEFFDVNSPRWFRFRYVTKVMYFDGYRWLKTSCEIFRGRVLIVPTAGQLLYVKDRHDRHVFFRSFGTFSTTAVPITSTTTGFSSTFKALSSTVSPTSRSSTPTTGFLSTVLSTSKSSTPTTRFSSTFKALSSTVSLTSKSSTPATGFSSTFKALSSTVSPLSSTTGFSSTFKALSSTVSPSSTVKISTTMATTSRSRNRYGYLGFLVLLLMVPFGCVCVWRKRRKIQPAEIQPARISMQRYFNKLYDNEGGEEFLGEVREVYDGEGEEEPLGEEETLLWEEIELMV